MTSPASRRAFLQRLGHVGVAGVAAPWALNLAAIGEAAAFGASDYKALVCVFLYGGNDFGNMLVPYDATNYAKYAAIRTGIVTPQTELAQTTLNPNVALPGGLQFALCSTMTGLKGLFDQGKAAMLLNVGPLIQPTTLAQYNAKSVPLPPKLFSHNDQQSVWQSSLPEGSVSGWGGRIGDLAMANNAQSLFTCMSVTGNAVYLAGQTALQYQVSTTGAVPISGVKSTLYGSTACSTALRSLVTAASAQVLENELGLVTARSIGAEATVTAALAGSAPLTTVFPTGNSLASQLKMVAQLIAARGALGTKRQVFLVSMGGFDLHDNLVALHPGLLGQVSDAMTAFYNATAELGVASQVTAFTASDFGRTYASNGDGADHGWGSHHFVVGGAVRGNRFYGTAPAVAVNGPDDVGQGRLLPTTSVDQFAATLATWFGVTTSELKTVVPNIGNYTATHLGFV